jgi:hypothetical protein
MLPILTVLLGSGATASAKMPTTEDLTDLIVKLPYSVPSEGVSAGKVSVMESLFSDKWLIEALNTKYQKVNFETILAALEQLEPLIESLNNNNMTDDNRLALSAFVELSKKYKFLESKNNIFPDQKPICNN